VMIHYRNGIAEMDVMLPETHRVRLSESLIQSLEEWLSAPNVAVKYEAVVPTARPQRYAAYSNE
jgi:hypothetical protein